MSQSYESERVSTMDAEMPRATPVSFPEEWRACWRQLPDKPLFFVLLTAWVLLFQFLGNSTFGYTDTPSLFGWLYNAYNAPGSDDGHGNLIPLVVLGLFWWKREDLLAVPRQLWWPALLLLGASAVAHIVGYVVQQPRVSTVAFFAGVYGLMGLLWGWRWLRACFFPFFLFVFCIPVGSLAESLTFPLRLFVSWLSSGISQHILGIAVIRDGTQLFDASRSFQFDVAAACSGIRSLTALLALTTIYGFVTFKAGWRRLLMIALAVPLAVVGNVARITTVVLAAKAFGTEAGLFVHDWFGFVTFAGALGCMLALGHWLREKPDVRLEANVT